MKKGLKFYLFFWALLVALFNTIAIVSPGWKGYEKYSPSFWWGFGFIMLAFTINLLFACLAFCHRDLKRIVYHTMFLKTNYSALIVSFFFGGIFMLIPVIKSWVCILLCAIMLAINLVPLIKTKAAAEIATALDNKVKEQTTFIKILTAEAQGLTVASQNEDIRSNTIRIYEAIRYSDPVSSEHLAEIEREIKEAFFVYKQAVKANDITLVNEKSSVLLEALTTRNSLCRALK